MPQLIYSEQAGADFGRLRSFLLDKNPLAARRASQAILSYLNGLAEMPTIGRPIPDTRQRELIIPFADSGYIVLYEFIPDRDVILINAIRHQREEGFR